MFQGVTFKVEGGDLIIARILHGGMVDQQGLLHAGDIIKEVKVTCSKCYIISYIVNNVGRLG